MLDLKITEISEIWFYRRILRPPWTEHVSTGKVLEQMEPKRTFILHIMVKIYSTLCRFFRNLYDKCSDGLYSLVLSVQSFTCYIRGVESPLLPTCSKGKKVKKKFFPSSLPHSKNFYCRTDFRWVLPKQSTPILVIYPH